MMEDHRGRWALGGVSYRYKSAAGISDENGEFHGETIAW
jgi:hypothetical protein